ncbi:hypothetical protein DFH06DRAFT_1173474 [Mycena polygramma]|nr:hypothetical protein DFH06DRAFT_1173474 [Mycena polygramma]
MSKKRKAIGIPQDDDTLSKRVRNAVTVSPAKIPGPHSAVPRSNSVPNAHPLSLPPTSALAIVTPPLTPCPPAHLVSAGRSAEGPGATTKQSRQWSKPADALQIQRSAHIAKLNGAGVELLKARRELKTKDKDQQQALQELDAKNKELRAALRVAVQSAAPKAAALEASIITIPGVAAPRLRKFARPSTTEVPFQAANVELQMRKDIPHDTLRPELTAVTAERDNSVQEREVWIRERRELLEAARLLKTKIEDLANENSALTLANTALTEENSGLKVGYEKVKLSTVALYDEVSVLAASNDALRRSNASLVDENTALWANDERHQNSLFVVEAVVRTLRGENELLVADLTRKTAELAAAELRSAAEVRSLEAIERVLKERDKSNPGRIVHIKEELLDRSKPGTVIDLPLDSDDGGAGFDRAAPTRPSHAVSSLPIVVDPTSAETRHNDFAVSPTTCPTVPEIKLENQILADIPVPQTEIPQNGGRDLIRNSPLASPPPSNTPPEPPSVRILPSTPDGFSIAGAEFTNAQLMDRVMQKGGGLQITAEEKWGLMLVHLELFAQGKHADFSVPVYSWRETAAALKEYYLQYLLHRESP